MDFYYEDSDNCISPVIISSDILEATFLKGISSRYMMSTEQAKLKLEYILNTLQEIDDHLNMEEQEEQTMMMYKNRFDSLDFSFNTSLEMIEYSNYMLQKFGIDLDEEAKNHYFLHSQEDFHGLQKQHQELFSTEEFKLMNLTKGDTLADKQIKIEKNIPEASPFPQQELTILMKRFGRLNEQYAFIRGTLPVDRKRIFDKVIKFSQFIHLEKEIPTEPIYIKGQDNSFEIKKEAKLAIEQFLPMGSIIGYLYQLLDHTPSDEFVYIFVLKKFDEFILFLTKILKRNRKAQNKPGTSIQGDRCTNISTGSSNTENHNR